MIYLNNGATSWPKPSCVCEAVQACLNDTPDSQFRGGTSILKKDTQELCRDKLGDLLGIRDTQRIFFTSGATESMNTVLLGLDFGSDDSSIIVTQTEHNSVLRPIMNHDALKTHPIEIVQCTSDGEISPKALSDVMMRLKLKNKKASAIIVNHCSNVTGYVQNMEMISDFAMKNHLMLIVDLSQSAGCIPVNIDKWRADAAVFTGHKSLFGMQGTGGFYVREGLKLRPLKYGGTGRNSRQLIYTDDYEYEAGTQNMPGIHSLLAGVEFILNTGIHTIQEKENHLMGILYDGLRNIDGIKVYGSAEKCKGPVMSFNFDGLKASDAAYILQSGYDIIVRAGLHCSPLIHEAMGTVDSGTVRVSISYMTEESDIRIILDAIEQIAASLKGANR